MKKQTALFITLILILSLLTGCSASKVSNHSESSSDISSDENTVNQYSNLEDAAAISPGYEIQELEKDFTAVRYDGDYGFDAFLLQGGAEKDRDILEFLTSYFLSSGTNLEINAQMFGCSTIHVPSEDGGFLFGRNFDWRGCKAMVVTAYPRNGYSSISTVNMDFIRQGVGMAASLLPDEILTIGSLYAPLDGMNEKGLCVAVNMIQDSDGINQDNGKPDITTTTAIRLMLDKATDTDEAVALLESYDLHASMNYMVHFAIADASGNSVVVEYINNEMVITKTPVLTNYYLAAGEKYGIGSQQSHTRFNMLTEMLEESPSMSPLDVRKALSSVSKDNFSGFESTEWSIVFDQENLTACYYHRENYTDGYVFSIE